MKKLYDLTNPQKSIWYTEQYYKNTAINNICGTLIIEDSVNFDLLKKALNIFVCKNDSMRIRLCIENNTVKQYINEYNPFDIETEFITETNTVSDIESRIIKTNFSLLNCRLYHFTIFKFSDSHGGFIANLHHIIADAWTMSLLIDEVMSIYSDLLHHRDLDIFSLYPSYLDFISSEQNYINGPKFSKNEQFWKDKFSEDLTYTYLNSNFSNSCIARRKAYTLSESQISLINSFCETHHITVPLLFMSVLGIYLSKIHNTSYATIGMPVLNRCNYKEKSTTGMFINTIPFKIEINEKVSVVDYLRQLSSESFSVFRNQKYPYNILLDTIRKEKNISQNLYDIAFSYQNARDEKSSSDVNYSCRWLFNGCVSNNMDIHVYDMDNTGILNIFYDYKESIFSENQIENIHNNLIYILQQILETPNIQVSNVEIISPACKDFIFNQYNNTKQSYPFQLPVLRLFEKQASLTPTHDAIVYKNIHLTYQELDCAANHLAYLFSHNGIQYQDKVCLFFNNSIELLASILALHKIGACYIPIDTKYPIDRVKYIFENSKSRKIISNSTFISSLNTITDSVLCVDFSDLELKNNIPYLENRLSSEDLAYIIYTSGSTGNPKGVQIAHKSLTNYIYWCVKQYVNGEITNFPLYSSISFDLTVTSIFTPLISGNAIYIYDNSNPELLLKEIIEDKKVQIIKLTPAHLTLLLNYANKNSIITKLIVGGDILTNEICQNISEAFEHPIKIYNEYGPTEATVGCMIYQYCGAPFTSVPIGVPIDNVKLWVLNDNLNLLPFDYNGELYISGDCLSVGYLSLEEINKERFLENPFEPNSKLYKTGDIVKLHSNGVMEYIGRSDFQIKINGYRIETGEIQSILLKYPSISDCYITDIVLQGHKELCAYYVTRSEINTIDLAKHLAKSVPAYMIPKYFIQLEEIPLTSNGKVDRKSLPLPSEPTHNIKITKPQNDLEKTLCNIFSSLLDMKEVSTTADLFDYYVDSLLLIKAQTRLLSKGYDIDMQAFYEHKTIQELAKYILDHHENLAYTNSSIPQITEVQESYNEPKHFKHLLLFGSTGFLGIHLLYNLLVDTDYYIYCLIRTKENKNSEERLYEKLNFYFPDIDFSLYSKRITVISGNITKDRFNLSDIQYKNLGKKIDIVLHTAALVKHYGNYNLFYQTNVLATQRIIDFCLENNLPLHYISTLSVSGYGLVKTPESNFSETNLYIGQDYNDNVYVRSKFEAEVSIIEACKAKHLIATIYRIGNLSNRYSDGFFQENAAENAALNRLISFINLRLHP